LLLELTAIVAFGYGFDRHREAPARKPEQAASPTPGPTGGRRTRRGAVAKDARIVAFVDHYRARHGRNPTARDIVAAFPGTPRSTAQRYATTTNARPLHLRAVS
jgi:hypothetical protein